MSGILKDILYAAAFCGISYISAAFSALIKRARERIAEDADRERLSCALSQLNIIAEATTGAIEQTLAKDLRQQVKAGRAPREKLENLLYAAIAEVSVQMNPDYLRAIEEGLLNPERFIENLIESKLLKIKQR